MVFNQNLRMNHTCYLLGVGLLAMALEPYLKGEVPDIKICIISISYERTLEENLYAFEVLGIPKPKESTKVIKKTATLSVNLI